MEGLLLIGGFLLTATVGYFAVDRMGRFLDENMARPKDKAAGRKGCNPPDSKVR